MGMTFDPSQLVVNMDAIRKKIADQGAKRACVAGARVIAAAMSEAAPVLDAKSPGSDSLDPGDIRDNIHIWSRTIDGQHSAMVGPGGKDGQIAKTAFLVEYGHRMVVGGKSVLGPDGVFRGGGKVREKDVPAHAFLRPAMESSAEEALKAMGASLEQDLHEGK